MRHIILLISIACFLSCKKQETTAPFDVYLNTQADVDNFKFKLIEGSLFINGEFITNIKSLNSLTEIKEGLIIKRNPLLESLEGLSNLNRIGGGLAINDCGKLKNLQGMGALVEIGNNIWLNNIPQLKTIEHLNSIEIFSGNLYISYADSLQNLEGIKNLYPNGISLDDNARLTDLSGLEHIITLEFLAIDSNGLISLKGLNALTEIDYLRVYNEPNLTDFTGFETIETINRLRIEDNNLLSSLNGFGSNVNISSIGIIYNPSLKDYCSLKEPIISAQQYNCNNNMFNPTIDELKNGQCNSESNK